MQVCFGIWCCGPSLVSGKAEPGIQTPAVSNLLIGGFTFSCILKSMGFISWWVTKCLTPLHCSNIEYANDRSPDICVSPSLVTKIVIHNLCLVIYFLFHYILSHSWPILSILLIQYEYLESNIYLTTRSLAFNVSVWNHYVDTTFSICGGAKSSREAWLLLHCDQENCVRITLYNLCLPLNHCNKVQKGKIKEKQGNAVYCKTCNE